MNLTARLAALLAVPVVLAGINRLGAADAPLLAPLVAGRLDLSGVESPVTAVLLNFRALDTLLEVTLLAGAVIGARALPPPQPPPRDIPRYSLLPTWLIPRLTPLVLLLVAYLWWAGSSRPGGAFQAGAAFTGALLLLHFIGRAGGAVVRSESLLWLAVAGPLLFLLVGAIPAAGGGALLDYPDGTATALILLIEAGLTTAIGGALALLAIGGGEGR